MKVLLINPSIRPNSPKTQLNVGLAYVASAIERAGFDLDIIDIDAHRFSNDEIDRLIRTKKFDVVGIGDLVSHYKWVKEASSLIRSYHPNVSIIVGNTCGTSIPRLLLEKTEVDVAVISEGDITAVELLRALDEGRPLDEVQGIAFKRDGVIRQTPPRPVIDPVDSIPFPNYDLFEMEIYIEKSKWHVSGPEMVDIPFEELVAMPVVTARGCPFHCTFCYHAFQNKKYRYRSPENIIGEIEQLKSKYGANFINFWDELSFYHVNQARRLGELFLERNVGVYWEGSCRSELIGEEDYEVAVLLKRAKCSSLSFSLENGNDDILVAMNKRNTSRDFIKQARILHEVGIPALTSVVFGYPQESPQTIAETFDVLRRAQMYPSVGFLQPMPGTPMYDLAIKQGLISTEEQYLLRMGDRQDLRINMTKMTEEEMQAVIEDQLRKLNQELKLGLSEAELIKTRVYRVAKSESFVGSFGIAAKIGREMDGLGASEPSC